MIEFNVPIPFELGHMRVKELQLMGKDKVQSLLVLEDLQQVNNFILIYIFGIIYYLLITSRCGLVAEVATLSFTLVV